MIYRLCGKHVSQAGGLFFRAFSILFFILYFVSSTFAAEVFIPTYLAQTRDRSEGANGKTIVIVEAAHVNYEAQKAIANLLQDLAENESLWDIFVEGGWGDVSLARLRQLTTPERRKKVAEEYLRQGKISGDEYLSLATDLDVSLWGVEDPKLYESNMKVFLEFSAVRPQLLKELKALDLQIQSLQPKILTPAMLEILTQRRGFEDQTISLLDYAQFLMSRLPGASKRFPHLAGLVSLSGENKPGDSHFFAKNECPRNNYDPDKLILEKKSAVQFLSQRLTKPELEGILMLDDQKTTEGELAFLEALLKKTHELSKSQPFPAPKNLIHYKSALSKIVRMDTAAIFPELEEAEQEAVRAQKPTPEQTAFIEVVRGARTLQKLFDLRLTEDEFLTMEKGKPSFDYLIGDTHFFAKNECPRFDSWIPVALSFYQTARAREAAMIENLDRAIQDRDLTRVALVIGGFHSRNIFNALQKRGYTVILVSPRFTPSGDGTQHEKYLEVLKSKWTGKEVPSSEFQGTSAKFAVPSSKIN